MKSAYLQQARARSFRWFIGKFDPIPPLFTWRPYRAELINTAERRVWLTGAELCSHAPDVDLRSALFHLRDREFIQIARANNLRIWKTCLVEHFSRCDAQRHAIGRIQAHPDHFMSIFAQLFGDFDRTAHTIER